MQFQLAYFFFALAVIIIATCTDIKKRVVPDWLSYSAIAIGIGIHAVESYLTSSVWPLAFSAGIAAITFGFGYGLWKLGVWAGGDVKLFTAIGAISPLNYAVFSQWILPNVKLLAPISIPVFPLTLFVFSAIAVLPYGAGIAIRETISNSALRKKVVSELRKNAIELLFFCLAAVGIGIITERLAISPWIGLAGIIVWGLLGKYRKIAGVVLIAIGFWLEPWNAVLGFAYLFAVLLAIYSVIKFYLAARNEVFRKTKKISELEEGEIPAESIVEIEGKIERAGPLEMGKIIKHLKANNLGALRQMLSRRGREIVSRRRAMGVTEGEIRELRELVEKGALEDKIEVKLSAPFVPAVLIAFIASGFLGDIIWRILL